MAIKRHFFGKDCIIDRSLLDRGDIAKKLSDKGFKYDELLFVNQIHSKEVVVIDDVKKVYDMHNLPKADALVTNLKNIAIAVFTADCAPVFLFDEEKEIIAVAHAGWRGAKLGVIKQTIFEMKKLGAKNIKAEMGPMIKQESYEVSQEFLDDFLVEDSGNEKFFIDGDRDGHYLFDLPKYVFSKLQEEGLKEISDLVRDTYENENELFSFRRSCHRKEEDCGRNVSVILVG